MTHDDLIAQLESATGGSRELDAKVAVFLGINPQHGGDGIYGCPHYTTSLDAKLPGESIVSMHSAMRTDGNNYWIAVQVSEDASANGRGHTEPLARRIAALKARQP